MPPQLKSKNEWWTLDGLGTVLSEDRTLFFFYKKLPCGVLDEALTNYGVNSDCYKNKFLTKGPDQSNFPRTVQHIIENSPDKNDLESVYTITAEE